MSVRQRVAINGPTTKPINPKTWIPPRTAKKSNRGWIFVLELMNNGLRKLSAMLIPNIPKSNRRIPFNKAP